MAVIDFKHNNLLASFAIGTRVRIVLYKNYVTANAISAKLLLRVRQSVTSR